MSEPDNEVDSEVDWQVACERAAILRRTFAGPDGRCELRLSEAARLLGVDRTTLYRWRKRYGVEHRASALMPRAKGWRSGTRILPRCLEELIAGAIKTFYLTAEAPSLAALVWRIQGQAREAGLRKPAWRTVRRRVEAIDTKERLRRREGATAASARCEPVVASFDVSEPLAVVQLDHTVVDVVVVDEVDRKPLGRPVVTFAIDVATRMVTGFYLGFDEPSVLRAGVCLSQSVFEKEAWLAARGVALTWPVAGLPRVVHVDNAGEFHASAFTRTLQDHGIQIIYRLIYRPIGKPRFGGHVERLIGTQMGAVHLLPGTTFSNTVAKGVYPSEQRAVMTLKELERWMLLEILGVYHQRIHAGLSRPPIAVWQERTRGLALPVPRNRMAFLVGLLPAERRMVRRDGVRLFGIRYWSDALGDLPGRGHQRLEVRYDPRDLSLIYVRRPQGQFVEVSYQNLGRASISLWEQRRAVGRLRAQGRAEVDETLIFETIEAQRVLEDAARRGSREARRQIVRRPAPIAPPRDEPRGIGPIDTNDARLRLFDVEVIHDKHRPDDALRARFIATASEEARICDARGDRWITYPKAAVVLDQMERILAHPRNWRMPSLLILGEAGIGKTQIDRKFARLHPPEIGRERGRTTMPVVSIQMPPGVTQRILYLTLLETIGVRGPARAMFETKTQALRALRDLEVRVIVFDEVHNLLAGGFREQRKILAELRYLSNELMLSFVCFGTHDAREAFAGDPQLARRFGLSELGAWDLDMDFAALIATVLKSLPLRVPSTLGAGALRAVIRLTRGNTAGIFEMMGDLAVEAIRSGEEQITDQHVERWRPGLFERTIVA